MSCSKASNSFSAPAVRIRIRQITNPTQPNRLVSFLVMLLILALSACSPGGATMVVENRSTSTIHSIVVSCREVQYKIPSLKAGEIRAFSARPQGESSIAVAYTFGGRAIVVPESGYFEGDPRYVVVVGLDGHGADIATALKTERP